MDPSALRESHPAKAPRSSGSTTHMSANRKKTDMSWRILLPTLTETKRKSLLQGNQSVAHDHARARRQHEERIDLQFSYSFLPLAGELPNPAQDLCQCLQVGSRAAPKSGQDTVPANSPDHLQGLFQYQWRRPDYKVSDRLYENSPEAESHNRPKTQVLSHPHDDFPRLAANHLLYQDAIQPRL